MTKMYYCIHFEDYKNYEMACFTLMQSVAGTQ